MFATYDLESNAQDGCQMGIVAPSKLLGECRKGPQPMSEKSIGKQATEKKFATDLQRMCEAK